MFLRIKASGYVGLIKIVSVRLNYCGDAKNPMSYQKKLIHIGPTVILFESQQHN